MTQVSADFEAGANTSAVTTGDTGSATAWDSVVNAGSSTITYSTTHVAHGTLAGKYNDVTSSSMWTEWTAAMGATTDNYGRVYMWRDSLDTGTPHYWLTCYSSAAAFIGRFLIDESSGVLKIQGSSGSIVATGSTAVATGQWVRLEYKIVNNTSTGVLEAKLFNTMDSTSPDDTVTATGLNTRADTNTVRFGSEQPNSAGYVYYLDDIVAGATGYPGPAGTVVQTLLPATDSVDGNWHDNGGGGALAAAIDEATFNDSDFITSDLHPTTSSSRVKLAAGIDPASSAGHVVHWRVRKDATGGDTVDMTVTLRQGGGNALGGGTQIATFSRTNVSGTGWTTYDETLSGGEADSITNYSDLYLEFTADT